MAHVSPLADCNIHDNEILTSFAHYEKTRGFVPNSIRTMARRPDIAKALMALNQAVLYEGTVPTETKMLVSLASSMAAGCRYCESHMTNLSSIYEAPDEKIAAIWEFESSELFSAAERAAIAIGMKAGASPNEATEEDFAELAKHYEESEIVEIVASAALFGYLNRWNDTMATTLEELPARVAERVIGDVGWAAGKHV